MQNLNCPRIDAGGLLNSADFDDHVDRHFGTRRSGSGPTLPAAAQCRADACRQGRLPCPSPQECQEANDDLSPIEPDGLGLLIGALVGLVFWSLVGFAAYTWWGGR